MSHCAIVQVRRCGHKTSEDSREVTILPSFDMLLFGGTGDLVTRKLLPALYRRFAAGQVSAESRIFGVARSALSREAYTAQAEKACREFLDKEFDARRWQDFSALLSYIKLDAGAEQDYAALPAVFNEPRRHGSRILFFDGIESVLGDLPKFGESQSRYTAVARGAGKAFGS